MPTAVRQRLFGACLLVASLCAAPLRPRHSTSGRTKFSIGRWISGYSRSTISTSISASAIARPSTSRAASPKGGGGGSRRSSGANLAEGSRWCCTARTWPSSRPTSRPAQLTRARAGSPNPYAAGRCRYERRVSLRTTVTGLGLGQFAFVRPFRNPEAGWVFQFSLVAPL